MKKWIAEISVFVPAETEAAATLVARDLIEVLSEATKGDLCPFTGAVLSHVAEDDFVEPYVLRPIDPVVIDKIAFGFEISKGGRRIYRTESYEESLKIAENLRENTGTPFEVAA